MILDFLWESKIKKTFFQIFIGVFLEIKKNIHTTVRRGVLQCTRKRSTRDDDYESGKTTTRPQTPSPPPVD